MLIVDASVGSRRFDPRVESVAYASVVRTLEASSASSRVDRVEVRLDDDQLRLTLTGEGLIRGTTAA